MSGFVDRQRASRLLAAAGLDALVVAEPEGFAYLSGVPQGVAGLFRRAGAGFAVCPADPANPVGIVIGDLSAEAARATIPDARSHPLWIEQASLGAGPPTGTIARDVAAAWTAGGRAPGFSRPATFDLALALKALRGLLVDRGLAGARLGFDFHFIAAQDAAAIRAALSSATITDGSPVLDRLRMVKTAGEIERLTRALDLSEAGLRAMTAALAEGHTVADLHDLFRQGIEAEAARRDIPAPPSWDYLSIGPNPWGAQARVAPGLVVKADVGCVVDGYSSDMSRNYCVGAPSADLAAFHRLLESAFDAGFAALRPGAPLRDAHRAATDVLRKGGLAGFSRGHFGHSLGHGVFSEQWPFIAADADTRLEPGMVMAFEVPIYVDGLGGFNIEDQFVVEAGGPRLMATLPRGLAAVGA